MISASEKAQRLGVRGLYPQLRQPAAVVRYLKLARYQPAIRRLPLERNVIRRYRQHLPAYGEKFV